MNVLAFVAALIQALAWPVVVLVLGVLFRQQVRDLLARPMQHLKVGPVEATWTAMIAEVRESVAELPPASLPQETANAADWRQWKAVTLKQMVRLDPGQAILTAHDLVYRQLQAMTGQDFGSSSPLPATAGNLARDALARGLVSPITFSAIEGITLLRNLVAHGAQGVVTSDQAQEYVAQVELILAALTNPP